MAGEVEACRFDRLALPVGALRTDCKAAGDLLALALHLEALLGVELVEAVAISKGRPLRVRPVKGGFEGSQR